MEGLIIKSDKLTSRKITVDDEDCKEGYVNIAVHSSKYDVIGMDINQDQAVELINKLKEKFDLSDEE